MSRRTSRRLAWGLVALAMSLLVAAYVLSLTTGTGRGLGIGLFIVAIATVFGTVGALIASRQPANAIGWLFLFAAVSAGIGNVAGSYAQYYVETRAGPPLLGESAAAYGELSWMPFILVPATFLLLLFPDGHLLSRRWRPVAWCAALGMGVGFVADGLTVGPIPDYPELTNPFGVDSPLISPLNGLALLAVAVGMVGSSASLIVRFRRSHGEQRQQIKWLALAGTVAVVTIVFGTLGYEALGEDVANSMMMLSVMGLPVAAGIAILRYRLYDIDVVINRALVYGALTAMLAGTYLGSVLLLQLALRTFTEGSGLAVAASTLATAAMFRPLRARTQAVVDRRFFRRKYDAARTLEHFSARLRDEVDLDTLTTELRDVIAETVQPTHVSLWIRTPEDAR